MNIINKLKELFNKKEIITINHDQALYDHLIAMARLSLIKPERLVKEAQNTKANADYLLRMIEAMKK